MFEQFFTKIQLSFCAILNPIWNCTKKIDKRNRDKLLRISLMLISLFAYSYSIFLSVHLLIKCIIGTICMLGILIFSIDRELKPVQWNKTIAGLWLGIGLLQIVTGLCISKEYLPLAFIWTIGFTMIFFVWNNRKDYDFLIENIYCGFLYPACLFFVLSILFSPIKGGYGAITGNANSVGQHVAAIFPLAIGFFLTKNNKKRSEKIMNYFLIACCLMFSFFSSGRTITVTILAILFACVIYILIFKKGNRWKIAKRSIVLVLGTVLITAFVFPFNKIATSVLPNYEYNVIEKSENKTGNMENVLDKYVDRMQGNDKAVDDLQNYSSGRIGIWEETIRKTNLFGHPSRDHIVTERNGDVGNNVHNVFLQFGYDYGVITGVLYSLMVIIAGITTIKRVFKQKSQRRIYFMILLIQVSFVCVAMFASISLPFLYEVTFVYYLVYTILFEKVGGDREKCYVGGK